MDIVSDFFINKFGSKPVDLNRPDENQRQGKACDFLSKEKNVIGEIKSLQDDILRRGRTNFIEYSKYLDTFADSIEGHLNQTYSQILPVYAHIEIFEPQYFQPDSKKYLEYVKSIADKIAHDLNNSIYIPCPKPLYSGRVYSLIPTFDDSYDSFEVWTVKSMKEFYHGLEFEKLSKIHSKAWEQVEGTLKREKLDSKSYMKILLIENKNSYGGYFMYDKWITSQEFSTSFDEIWVCMSRSQFATEKGFHQIY